MSLAPLRRPLPWAALSGIGLLVALCVTSKAPDWLFWGAVALSCVGAAAASSLGQDAPRA